MRPSERTHSQPSGPGPHAVHGGAESHEHRCGGPWLTSGNNNPMVLRSIAYDRILPHITASSHNHNHIFFVLGCFVAQIALKIPGEKKNIFSEEKKQQNNMRGFK